MDNTIFRKLRAKLGMRASILYAPPEYPVFDGFCDKRNGVSDFVHLFVSSKLEFEERYAEATKILADGGLLWVSYPKSKGKRMHDINRDILWDLVIPLGWHPVALVSLNEQWSAIRLKLNELDKIYERPKGIKTKS
jgi:hypothetical protein